MTFGDTEEKFSNDVKQKVIKSVSEEGTFGLCTRDTALSP